MHQNGTGRGRGSGYNNYSRPGPLITDHLQVRNLDRELELLRRKREVVQREQQMLTMECDMDRKRQYEHSNRNVSNTYGNVWQATPPKRANPSQRQNSWTGANHDNFGRNMSKPMPDNYIPSLLSKPINLSILPVPPKPIVHPMLKTNVAQRLVRPTNVRKDFRPTNITKKKPNTPPNKLNTYPLKQRKNLVMKATESPLSKNKAKKPLDVSETLVLRENQTPNNQVSGRLELALGSIVKEMRSLYSDNDVFNTLITNPKHQRTMKKAVRERIRTVMLNKTVGPVTEILAKYRERFPKSSDKDIVELVINSAEHPNNVTMIETDHPEEFFKKNISSILEKKIKEMASKLLKMYTNDGNKPTSANTKAANDTNKEHKEKESISNDEEAMKVIRSLTGKYITVEEKNTLNMYYTELIENILEKKLPEYLPQCKNQFLKIFDLDNRFKAIELMTTERVRDNVEVIKTEVDKLKNEDEASPERSEEKEDVDCDDNEIEDKVVSENTPSEEIITDTNKATEATKIIPMSTDTEESSSIPTSKDKKPLVAKEAESPDTAIPTTLVAKKSPDADKTTTPTTKTDVPSTPMKSLTVSTPSAKELPYYVKLIGRPKLPNRAVICDFLNKFQPASIKKHKSINNLLVVGFTNQEDYNKILAANETVIGDTTMIVKASEKVTTGKDNEAANEGNKAKKDIQDSNNTQEEAKDNAEQNANVKNELEEKNDSKNAQNNEQKDLIGKELDDQISEFLTTIKETDENNDCDKSPSLEPAKDGGVEANNETAQESEKVDKIKANVKETGRATPVRSSSRLGNVTPSTIRTRRASRLMQE